MRRTLGCTGVLLLLAVRALSAQMAPPPGSDPLRDLSMLDPRLRAAAESVPIGAPEAVLAPGVREGWTGFLAGAGAEGSWQGLIDRRTGWLEIAEGAGIPWIPGQGNHLTPQDVGATPGKGADLALLEKVARVFLPDVAPLLGVTPDSLVLSRGRSGAFGGYLWYVDFDVLRDGLPIEGARVVFRVNHGNLVQIATEGLPSAGTEVPPEQVSRKDALATLARQLGGFDARDTFLDGGSVHLLPILLGDGEGGEAQGFEPGKGRGLARVWEFRFRRKGSSGTWRARVDATTGEILEFRDINAYARVTGGVHPDSYVLGNETVLPMPFADLTGGGTTNAAGVYDFTGGTVSSTLNGPFVRILDTCGPISKSSSGSGRIAFGTSAGTDCVTPGTGGAGNTHSSRTQFYHLNRAKEIARGWLPGNPWLSSKLTANVNIFSTCNAYWDGTVNFFRSGSGCGNTGEIAGVSLHEYGHGFDENDGNGFSPDLGTGEAYGDFTAALTLHSSCMGAGFFSTNCGGYGDACTSCTGIRDLDWAQHASNTPHTVANFTQPLCPFGFGYDGPCGREGHCESQIASEALWDLAARDLPDPGGAAAWAVMERLWYLSRPTATGAFTCHTTASWTSDGCSAGSLWRTMRLADDDDGNLANGTPHSCQLYAAFNRHGIACPADPGANVCFSACTPPAAPAVTPTSGDGQVALSWSDSGPGVVYDVYKTELGCDSGSIKIADNLTSAAFLDTVVANGLTYSYRVIAHPAGNEACGAAPSACQSATPQGPPCTPPAVPSGVTATSPALDRILVSWNASAGATDYEIYRAASSGGPYTRVTVVAAPATTFLDTGLAEGTTYFYVVRALAEDCSSGDSAEAQATTQVCFPETLYANDFESGTGLADWTVELLFGSSAADWRGIQTCTAHSGSRIFRFGGAGCTATYQNSTLTVARPQGATGIAVPEDAARVRLIFWHRWEFESCCDGGSLLLGVDGGASVSIPGSAIVSGTGYSNGFRFTGTQSTFVSTTVDLDTVCNAILGGSGGCAGHTISIGFRVFNDGSVTGQGWFLDDVAVTTCTAHGCTGAPGIGTATIPGDNQVQLTWANGAPPSSSFNVYRALGTCAAPGPYERIASVPGLSHLDNDVSGGLTYAYRVEGLDASGVCESDLSGCVQATATGPCTLAPAFAGLASATDSVQPTCTLGLSWAAASPLCDGPVTYNVYRSTSPGFTPGPGNRIAQGVTGTSYSDQGQVVEDTTYYYVVRAVDASNGREDNNTVRRSASPTGTLFLPGSLVETFEGSESGGGFDNEGWTHAARTGSVDWAWSTQAAQSPTHSWFADQVGSTGDQVLVSPPFVPHAGTSLTFWHTYEFESCFDGGTLEMSLDGGSSWTVLPDTAFTAGGFTENLYNTTNPISGLRGWCRGTLGALTEVRADLSAWSGLPMKLRWHAGEDHTVAYTGWLVDSVMITNADTGGHCNATPPPALAFYTVPPCRLVDTRDPAGPRGGPVLSSSSSRSFPLAGFCGIPGTAKALSVNLTATQPSAAGYLTLFPDGTLVPLTSSINFSAGRTRANNAVLPLGSNGALRVQAAGGGTVHFILDVNGYFEEVP